jgi:DNA-binding MarR family transcriptional regulator
MKPKLQSLADSTPDGGLRVGLLNAIVGYRLAQAAVTSNQVFDAVMQGEPSLRQVEFTVLALVHANPDCTAGQVAKALAMTPPNITAWLDKLAARGCIERERSEADRRAQHVRATPLGARLVERSAQRLAEAEAAAFAGLSVAERAMLHELLHKAARARQVGRRAPAGSATTAGKAKAESKAESNAKADIKPKANIKPKAALA